MSRRAIVVSVLSLALVGAVGGCGSGGTAVSGSGTADGTAANDEPYVFDANVMYVGRWLGTVEVGDDQASFGEPGSYVQLLTVALAADGTAAVSPNAEYPASGVQAASGTWEGTETEVTLHLESGANITLVADGVSSLTGRAADFGIAEFDTIQFAYFG